MKPFVSTLGCVVIVLIAMRTYRLTHRPVGAGQNEPVQQEPTATLVLPATSESWSNLSVRTASRARINSQKADIAETLESPAPSLNEQAVQSRTKELLARASLSSVGLDPDADQYWLAAISDGRLSPEQRRELIFGLNDGLNDPSRIEVNDLPLLASRIALLEEAAPHAVDNDDATAFEEVYRELLSLFASLTASQTAALTAPAE